MTFSFSRDTVLHAMERAGELKGLRGDVPAVFSGITDDSRKVSQGCLFIAVRGATADGHDFIPAAAKAGAMAVIAEDAQHSPLPTFLVRDSRRAAGIAAAAAFGNPGRELTCAAVTGTNGKTTTVGMLRHILDSRETPAASIGTLGVLVGSAGVVVPGGAGLTTPGPVELQRVLRALRDSGVERVAMEVSSHSLDQQRVAGATFSVGVFTNVTRDHLDYHGTMEAYVAAKAKLLSYLAPGGIAVINSRVPQWQVLHSWSRRITYGILEGHHDVDVAAFDVSYTEAGSTWTLDCGGERRQVELPLHGDFNVVNALGAAAAAWALDLPASRIADRLTSMPQVPGRLERLHERPTILRDYAHTPDALSRVLEAMRPFVKGRLIVVFGCGGDRDRGKRPEMGAIAESRSDLAIVTSDNPRTEDPQRILDDIVAGMRRANHERIEDRRAAIARAIEIARPEDAIILAGKGHETYQIRGTISHPFDEKEVVRELLSGRVETPAGRAQ